MKYILVFHPAGIALRPRFSSGKPTACASPGASTHQVLPARMKNSEASPLSDAKPAMTLRRRAGSVRPPTTCR